MPEVASAQPDSWLARTLQAEANGHEAPAQKVEIDAWAAFTYSLRNMHRPFVPSPHTQAFERSVRVLRNSYNMPLPAPDHPGWFIGSYKRRGADICL